MEKIFTILLLISLSLFGSSHKAQSCELSQVGDVSLFLEGHGRFAKTNYTPVQKSGKNFKAIFVGSTINIEGIKITILDIQADKRIKGKPRTGKLLVHMHTDRTDEEISMKYTYSKGDFNAAGFTKQGNEISFALKIEALLCHAK